MLRNVMVAMF